MATRLAKHAVEGALAGARRHRRRYIIFPAEKYLPEFHPPQSEDPGSFMLWQVEKHLPRKTWMKIPRSANTAAGLALSFGYGAAFGLLYGLFGKRKPNILVDGAALGLVTWAVGYLGWLPAAKLTPTPWKQTPAKSPVRSLSTSPTELPPWPLTRCSTRNGDAATGIPEVCFVFRGSCIQF